MGKHSDRSKQNLPPASRKVLDAVSQKAADGSISCAEAFALAKKIGCPPLELGSAMDALDLRISRCQMGLFGYGDKPRPANEKEALDEVLAEALKKRAEDGRISCVQCWEAAAECKASKISAARGANALGLRIKPCQLGAF